MTIVIGSYVLPVNFVAIRPQLDLVIKAQNDRRDTEMSSGLKLQYFATAISSSYSTSPSRFAQLRFI